MGMIRSNRTFACLELGFALLLLLASGTQPAAQEESSRFHVNVVLVQLNVAVTDGKGNYISGLRPEDFVVKEDDIPEKIATFEEGDEILRRLSVPAPSGKPNETPAAVNVP